MKLIEIVPRRAAALYSMLVAKEAAIRAAGRGTYARVGRKSAGSTRWKHKKFKGSVQLKGGGGGTVSVKLRGANPEDERKLLSSFLGFVDRHSADKVDTITIAYR